jgi:hypothetical protein
MESIQPEHTLLADENLHAHLPSFLKALFSVESELGWKKLLSSGIHLNLAASG